MARRKGLPPMVRCRCGRHHRAWKESTPCTRCVIERIREAEQGPTVPEPITVNVEYLEHSLRSWLSKQPGNHPWRENHDASNPRPEVDVAAGGGEA